MFAPCLGVALPLKSPARAPLPGIVWRRELLRFCSSTITFGIQGRAKFAPGFVPNQRFVVSQEILVIFLIRLDFCKINHNHCFMIIDKHEKNTSGAYCRQVAF
jgi:hypothetical protein